MLLSNKREQTNDTCNNVDKSQKYVVGEISQTLKAKYILHDPTDVTVWKRQKAQKSDQQLTGPGDRRGNRLKEEKLRGGDTSVS